LEEHEETIGVFIALTSGTYLFTKVQSSPLNKRLEDRIETRDIPHLDSRITPITIINWEALRSAHDDAHGAFITFPPYTRTREGEVHPSGEWPNVLRAGHCVMKCSLI
jgi:hypothetical protein